MDRYKHRDISDVMKEAYKRNWITSRDGNISVRDGDLFYITPSGCTKYNIPLFKIIRGKFVGDEVEFIDDSKPSGELAMHVKLQSTHNKYLSVVHLHPTNTIAAMFKGWNLVELAERFPELSRYTNVASSVGVHPVCSRSLAIETFQRMTEFSDRNDPKIMFDIVGQAQHGVTAVGSTPWEAFEHIERLEHICTIALNSGVKP